MVKLVQTRPLFTLKPAGELFLTLMIVFFSFLILMIAGMLLAVPLYDIDFSTLSGENLILEDDNLSLLKYLQVIQSIALFIVPPFIIGWLLSNNTLLYLDLKNAPPQRMMLLTLVAMFSALPVINFLAEVNSWLTLPESLQNIEQWMRQKEDEAMELTKWFLKADSIQVLLFNIFMIGLLPAIGEELLFRGILQKQFTRWFKSHHAGILISSLLFSAMHLQFYGFLPRTLLGVMFGYMLVWSGTLWLPMLAHFVNNTAIVIITYFTGLDLLDPSVEELGSPGAGVGYFFIGLVVFIPVMWLFYQYGRNANSFLPEHESEG